LGKQLFALIGFAGGHLHIYNDARFIIYRGVLFIAGLLFNDQPRAFDRPAACGRFAGESRGLNAFPLQPAHKLAGAPQRTAVRPTETNL
jgi:hypothetical protein